MNPLVLAACAKVSRPCDELPASSDPGDRDRSGRTGAADSSRPMGVRLFSLSQGLRGPVQHALGDDRFHRTERRDPRDSRQQSSRGQAAASSEKDSDPRRDDARARCCSTPAASIMAAARIARTQTRVGINITYNVSWLRQEENQYLSVPLEIARTLAGRSAAPDGLRARRLRARLCRRLARSDRSRAPGPEAHRLLS